MLSCPTAFGREHRWTHLTTPQHLCCTLVGLINSGFVGISLEKREENRTQVTFGQSLLPSGSVQMPPSWVKVSLNFCQNWPSLLLWSQKHCLWFYLDMVLHLSTHDCFTLPESTLLRTGLYHLSFCPGMTPSDVSGRHSHLWIELNYHHLCSWVWVMANLLPVSCWVIYITSWGLGLLVSWLGQKRILLTSTNVYYIPFIQPWHQDWY